MNEYRLQIKVKNNLILKQIEKLGYSTVGEFCRENNLIPSVIGNFINFKDCPLRKDGTVKKECQRLLDIFGCLLQDLYTEDQIFGSLKTTYSLELSRDEVQYYLQNPNDTTPLLEHEVEEEEFKEKFRNEIDTTLKPREAKIIKMYWGVCPYEKEHTHEEIGEGFNLTRERVRQIVARSLRKLRGCLKNGTFADSLDDDRYGIAITDYDRRYKTNHLCY